MTSKGSKSSQNKKKQQVIVQRNVLASPYDKFWPLLNSEDAETLINLLRKLLPVAAIAKGYLTSKKLRKISRERDKLKRKEMWKQKTIVVDASEKEVAKQNRKYLLLGVNAVTRGIENSKVAGCLISSDATPRLIVSHIITMAARSKVPVLVVPSLKQITKTSLGVPCLVLALHAGVVEEKDNNFYTLYETIVDLSKKFVVPEHLHKVDIPINECIIIKNDLTLPEDTTAITNEIAKNEISTDSSFAYLHRTNTNQRVFVPPKVDIKLESSNISFIPIEGNKEVSVGRFEDYKRKMKRSTDVISDEEEDDDIDEENENLFELLPDSDSLFCIDTKGSDKNINNKSNALEKTFSKVVQLKPTVVRKIKSNPNKKKRKLSNKH